MLSSWRVSSTPSLVLAPHVYAARASRMRPLCSRCWQASWCPHLPHQPPGHEDRTPWPGYTAGKHPLALPHLPSATCMPNATGLPSATCVPTSTRKHERLPLCERPASNSLQSSPYAASSKPELWTRLLRHGVGGVPHWYTWSWCGTLCWVQEKLEWSAPWGGVVACNAFVCLVHASSRPFGPH